MMIYLLVCYLLALILSLIIESWRVVILAVALESLVTGLILIEVGSLDLWTVKEQVVDLILLRGLVVPLILISVLKQIKTGSKLTIVPANFVIWVMALMLLIGSYWFCQKIFLNDLPKTLYLGTAIAGVLIGLFVLANWVSPISQVIGLLTMESGIMLAEIFSEHHEEWLIQLGLSFIFLWMIMVIQKFMKQLSVLEDSQLQIHGPIQEAKDVL